jgi:ribosomal protein S18 acetylase RimI-like enzyme
MELRPVFVADLPFLAEMTLLAAFRPGQLPDGATLMPHVTRWTDDWGRPGDMGVVAWSSERRVGAAWCRIQEDVIARDASGRPVPEIAIAVTSDQRNRGLGTRLLADLAEAAAAAEQRALCLTVNARNPAFHLYQRLGFEIVSREGDQLTMVKPLAATQTR